MSEELIERVQELVDRAKKLRMRSVAIPTSDLEDMLRLCDADKAKQSPEPVAKKHVETT
jgi:hypothetical protein